MRETPYLGVKDLVVGINGTVILKGVSISLEPGSIHVLLGSNGAGKTTLVKTITGMLKPTAGKVYAYGRDVTNEPPERRGIGVVLQGAPLLPLGNVLDHIMFPLRARGVPRSIAEREARRIAELLGITDILDYRLEKLSGGQRQRVAFATALASSRKCLVLDEPFSNIEPSYRQHLYKTLSQLRSEGAAILVTTHILDDLLLLADKIWVMSGGSIVESGSFWDIIEKPRSPYTKTLLGILHSLARLPATNTPKVVEL